MIQNKFYQVDLLKKAIFFTWGVAFMRAKFKQIITSCTIFRLRWFAKHPRLQNAAANYRLFPILVYIHITTSRSFGFISNNHINATALSWRSKRCFIAAMTFIYVSTIPHICESWYVRAINSASIKLGSLTIICSSSSQEGSINSQFSSNSMQK